jgi:hypothetical protein
VGLVLVIILFSVTIVVFANRPQEVLECPFRHLPALPAPRQVCEAEMDAFIDAGVHHIPPLFREATIRARLLDYVRIAAVQ